MIIGFDTIVDMICNECNIKRNILDVIIGLIKRNLQDKVNGNKKGNNYGIK